MLHNHVKIMENNACDSQIVQHKFQDIRGSCYLKEHSKILFTISLKEGHACLEGIRDEQEKLGVSGGFAGNSCKPVLQISN